MRVARARFFCKTAVVDASLHPNFAASPCRLASCIILYPAATESLILMRSKKLVGFDPPRRQ